MKTYLNNPHLSLSWALSGKWMSTSKTTHLVSILVSLRFLSTSHLVKMAQVWVSFLLSSNNNRLKLNPLKSVGCLKLKSLRIKVQIKESLKRNTNKKSGKTCSGPCCLITTMKTWLTQWKNSLEFLCIGKMNTQLTPSLMIWDFQKVLFAPKINPRLSWMNSKIIIITYLLLLKNQLCSKNQMSFSLRLYFFKESRQYFLTWIKRLLLSALMRILKWSISVLTKSLWETSLKKWWWLVLISFI